MCATRSKPRFGNVSHTSRVLIGLQPGDESEAAAIVQHNYCSTRLILVCADTIMPHGYKFFCFVLHCF